MSEKFEFYQSSAWLQYMIYPDFWSIVTPKDVIQAKLTVQDFKNLQFAISINHDNWNQNYLAEEDRSLLNKVKHLYEKKKILQKEIQDNLRRNQSQDSNYANYGNWGQGGYSQGYAQNYSNNNGYYAVSQRYGTYDANQQQNYYDPNQNQQQWPANWGGQQQWTQQEQQQWTQQQQQWEQQPWQQQWGGQTNTGNYYQHNNSRHRGEDNYRNRNRGEGHYTQKTKYHLQRQEEEIKTPEIKYETIPELQPALEPVLQPEPVQEEAKPVELPKKVKFSVAEIKKMIAEAKKEEIVKLASENLVKEVQQMNAWKRKEQTVEIVATENPRLNKKQSKQPNEFAKGKNYKNREPEIAMGSNYGKAPATVVPDIQLGKNESLETRIEKKKLREKASEVNYAKRKEDEEKDLGHLQKATRDIVYHLNRIAPENLKDIFKELWPFAKDQLDTCETLITLIIEKSWEQPKYASSYAKLCSYFVKLDFKDYKFEVPNQKKSQKTNAFKHLLIERVQHSFDKQERDIPIFEDKLDEESFLRETKKNMLGNVKFIGELIKFKVIKKKTIKYCVQQLLFSFLQEHHLFTKGGEFKYSFYEYQFEALIQFLENLGEKYESIDDEKEEPSKYSEAEKMIKDICEKGVEPLESDVLGNLKADEYFKIFIIIDKNILSKKKGRISALLQNLEERRDNKWKKHHVEAEGPKKLKDIKNDDQIEPEQKMKNDLVKLDESIVKAMKLLNEGDKAWMNEIDKLTKSYQSSDFLTSFFKMVAEEKKDPVLKRLEEGFEYIVDKHYQAKGFKLAWENSIKHLAYLSSDIPFCGAALAKILASVNEKKGVRLNEFFLKFNEEEEEDQFYFMEEIYQKLFHYTQNEQIKEFVTPKAKLSHLL